MADRRATSTGKDSNGDITALCGDFGKVVKADAILHIEGHIHTYYVNEAGYRSDVYVVTRNYRKHLQTFADKTSKNNLDNLPDC